MSTFTGNGNNFGPPPGFFHGHGGPRTQILRGDEQVNRYNFQRSKENGAEGPRSNGERKEPLNDELLEGCANLLDQTGKRVQVILRDGRIVIGDLASVDHFSNLLLTRSVERIVVEKEFGDITRGILIVRGDNIVMIGEIDPEKEMEMERTLRQVSTSDILQAQKHVQNCEKVKQDKYLEALKLRGMTCPRQFEEEF